MNSKGNQAVPEKDRIARLNAQAKEWQQRLRSGNKKQKTVIIHVVTGREGSQKVTYKDVKRTSKPIRQL